MVDMTELKNIVRKGIVQNVDTNKMRARVKFGDKGGIISSDLYILVTPRTVVPSKEEENGDKVSMANEHEHTAYLTQWIPQIGDMVLCLMIPDGDGEGYILGGIK
jgi:Phage-related baseplate assembly protein.